MLAAFFRSKAQEGKLHRSRSGLAKMDAVARWCIVDVFLLDTLGEEQIALWE